MTVGRRVRDSPRTVVGNDNRRDVPSSGIAGVARVGAAAALPAAAVIFIERYDDRGIRLG